MINKTLLCIMFTMVTALIFYFSSVNSIISKIYLVSLCIGGSTNPERRKTAPNNLSHFWLFTQIVSYLLITWGMIISLLWCGRFWIEQRIYILGLFESCCYKCKKITIFFLQFSGFVVNCFNITKKKCPPHCIYYTKMQSNTKFQNNWTINNGGDRYFR